MGAALCAAEYLADPVVSTHWKFIAAPLPPYFQLKLSPDKSYLGENYHLFNLHGHTVPECGHLCLMHLEAKAWPDLLRGWGGGGGWPPRPHSRVSGGLPLLPQRSWFPSHHYGEMVLFTLRHLQSF